MVDHVETAASNIVDWTKADTSRQISLPCQSRWKNNRRHKERRDSLVPMSRVDF